MQNKVLETTKFVVDNSKFVRINHDNLLAFSEKFDHGTAKHWLKSAPFDFSNLTNEEKLHFIILLDALSFCYWEEPKWVVAYQGQEYDGAFGMILALRRGVAENKKLLNFTYCSQITKQELSHILRANRDIPLLEERWNILRETSSAIIDKYAGQVSNMIEESEHDAQKLVELISHIPSFADTSIFEGKEIFFMKRAQLLAADIYQIFEGTHYGALKNIEQLTACADYKIPQILRKYGILQYSPELANKIDTKTEIKHNSPEEIEIRANTIWAIEFIRKNISYRNPKILSIGINDHLWLATQDKRNFNEPYHHTWTTFY